MTTQGRATSGVHEPLHCTVSLKLCAIHGMGTWPIEKTSQPSRPRSSFSFKSRLIPLAAPTQGFSRLRCISPNLSVFYFYVGIIAGRFSYNLYGLELDTLIPPHPPSKFSVRVLSLSFPLSLLVGIAYNSDSTQPYSDCGWEPSGAAVQRLDPAVGHIRQRKGWNMKFQSSMKKEKNLANRGGI